ncbi:uncharacterized protein LOC128252697 [Drosophila gunungcola]|uniref:uncharacterized protein LOC128252697 n=1 Tax=Drosophila gunungcola TaxID=103775 RepID=UPI0022E5D542|nr:uncharacterized protein LOC128252697 [Drosophila gunungcola]
MKNFRITAVKCSFGLLRKISSVLYYIFDSEHQNFRWLKVSFGSRLSRSALKLKSCTCTSTRITSWLGAPAAVDVVPVAVAVVHAVVLAEDVAPAVVLAADVDLAVAAPAVFAVAVPVADRDNRETYGTT